MVRRVAVKSIWQMRDDTRAASIRRGIQIELRCNMGNQAVKQLSRIAVLSQFGSYRTHGSTSAAESG